MGGVIDFIEIKTMREYFMVCYLSISLFKVFVFGFSGGILGWDPVHTTCIPDEMMMRL